MLDSKMWAYRLVNDTSESILNLTTYFWPFRVTVNTTFKLRSLAGIGLDRLATLIHILKEHTGALIYILKDHTGTLIYH
jgi:hypothetical protein